MDSVGFLVVARNRDENTYGFTTLIHDEIRDRDQADTRVRQFPSEYRAQLLAQGFCESFSMIFLCS